MFFLKVMFDGIERKLAFVRWYEKFGVEDATTGCRIVSPETISMFVRPNDRSKRTVSILDFGQTSARHLCCLFWWQVPFYDVLDVDNIKDIVCLRRMPKEKAWESHQTRRALFWVNKYAP